MPSRYNQPRFSDPTGDYLEVSWEMFGELCRALALKVAREYRPDLVVGIARAGVIPGAIVASMLRLDFHALKISRGSADNPVVQRPEVLDAAPRAAAGHRVLLVDEITTSGETLRLGLAAVRDVAPAEVRTGACFVRPQGYKPDYFALETGSTVIFPWDRKIFQDRRFVVNPRYEKVLDE